jgi:hypothetical protein
MLRDSKIGQIREQARKQQVLAHVARNVDARFQRAF